MKYFNINLIVLIVLIGCNTKNEKAQTPKDSTIVFFNIKKYSRVEIGKYIDKIDSLGPKLICVSALFDSLKDSLGDSLLAFSIKKSRKVILAAYINKETNQLIRSHPIFRSNVKSEGVISYLVDKDGSIASYEPLYQDLRMQMISYPNEIAFAYRITENNRITKFEINQKVDIEFKRDTSDFMILNEGNINADLVKNKIVLFGNLSPDEKDTYIIKVNGKKVNVPFEVVNANVILNILSAE